MDDEGHICEYGPLAFISMKLKRLSSHLRCSTATLYYIILHYSYSVHYSTNRHVSSHLHVFCMSRLESHMLQNVGLGIYTGEDEERGED